MNMRELHSLAESNGIKYKALSSLDLIKTIQISEGNFDCFATAYNGECDQNECCWRKDCFQAATEKSV